MAEANMDAFSDTVDVCRQSHVELKHRREGFGSPGVGRVDCEGTSADPR